MDLCLKLAEYEVGWWKTHHRGDKKGTIENMVKEYKLLYGMQDEDAKKCVKFIVEAGREHDIAEDFEDSGNQKEADIHWKKAEELAKKHFEILLNKKSNK